MDVAQLKRRRLAAAIPGNLLCGRAGISRTRLSDIERGYVSPSRASFNDSSRRSTS